MRHATIEDFDVVKGIFKENRDVFPYLRFDSLKHKIKEGKVVYDTGVVITYNKYKRKQKLGNVQANMGDIVIQEIVKEEGGDAEDVFLRFVDFWEKDITNHFLRILSKCGLNFKKQIFETKKKWRYPFKQSL